MGSKRINTILIVVTIALIVAFAGCLIYSFFKPDFSFVDTISAVSSFFVAILTVITVYTTSRQLDFMKQQLDQMEKDHRLSEQPVLDVVTPKFEIERPRFFHSPKDYSFQSRYFFSLQINNLSAYPAVFADVSAELIVEEHNREIVLGAVSRRINVIAANATSNTIEIMFAGDGASRILAALRSAILSELPKLRLSVTYKSLSGANYLLEHTYLLDLREEDDQVNETLKNWHTTIVAAPIEQKDAIDKLKRISTKNEWDTLFEASKTAFDRKLAGGDSLFIDIIEIPEDFSIKCVSDDEFKEVMESHQYGRYIGKHIAHCPVEQ